MKFADYLVLGLMCLSGAVSIYLVVSTLVRNFRESRRG